MSPLLPIFLVSGLRDAVFEDAVELSVRLTPRWFNTAKHNVRFKLENEELALEGNNNNSNNDSNNNVEHEELLLEDVNQGEQGGGLRNCVYDQEYLFIEVRCTSIWFFSL